VQLDEDGRCWNHPAKPRRPVLQVVPADPSQLEIIAERAAEKVIAAGGPRLVLDPPPAVRADYETRATERVAPLDPWAGLDLPPAPGADSEPGASPPADVQEDRPEVIPLVSPTAADPSAPDAWLDSLKAPAVAVLGTQAGGRWTPENTGRIINPALNALFEGTGKEKMSPADERYTGEVWAPILEDLLSRVDPNSKWGALSLWALMVPGSRYIPDAVGMALGRKKAPAAIAAPAPQAAADAPPVAVPVTERAFSW